MSTKTLVVNKYGLLDDIESADDLMNDSDTGFLAEEEITQAASTQGTSLTTPEANLHVVPSEKSVISYQKYNPI